MARLLAIDPDRKQSDLVSRLERDAAAHEVVSVGSWEEARAAIDSTPPDLIVVAAEPQWAYWFRPSGSSVAYATAAAHGFVDQAQARETVPDPGPPQPAPRRQRPGLLTRVSTARKLVLAFVRAWTPAALKIAAVALALAIVVSAGSMAWHWWSTRTTSAANAPQTAGDTEAALPPGEAADTASVPDPNTNGPLATTPGWIALSSPVELTAFERGHELRFDRSKKAMLPAGRHEVMLVNVALGYRENVTVDVKPGVGTPISIVPPKTRLTITTTPDADVSVDGVSLGRTPITDVALDLGSREIALVNPIYGERRFTILATMRPVRLDIDLRKPLR